MQRAIDTVAVMTKQRVLVGSVVGVFVVMITVGVAAAAPFGPHRGGRGDHDGGVAMVVFCVLAAIAIGAAVALLVRRRNLAVASAGAAPASVSNTASAETILAERLARGEISPEDYRITAAALRGEVAPPSTPEV